MAKDEDKALEIFNTSMSEFKTAATEEAPAVEEQKAEQQALSIYNQSLAEAKALEKAAELGPLETAGVATFTAAEQLADTASFGLSDVLMKAAHGTFGEEGDYKQYIQDKRERELAFPTAATVGQLGGLLTPTGLEGKIASTALKTPAMVAPMVKGAGTSMVAGAKLRGASGEGLDQDLLPMVGNIVSDVAQVDEIFVDAAFGGFLGGAFTGFQLASKTAGGLAKTTGKSARDTAKALGAELDDMAKFDALAEKNVMAIFKKMNKNRAAYGGLTSKIQEAYIGAAESIGSANARNVSGLLGFGMGGPVTAAGAYLVGPAVMKGIEKTAKAAWNNPQVQDAMLGGMLRSLQASSLFLRSASPVLLGLSNPAVQSVGLRGLVLTKHDFTEEELRVHNNYVTAVSSPKKAVTEIKNGNAKPEYLHTIQALYPMAWSELQVEKIAEVHAKAKNEEPITEEDKMALKQLGLEWGAEYMPHAQQTLQMLQQPQETQPQAQAPKKGPTSKVSTAKVGKLKTSLDAATGSQQTSYDMRRKK